jgi:hypothetical protein
MLDTPGLSRGRKRGPPGIAVRAMEKLAGRGVDSVGPNSFADLPSPVRELEQTEDFRRVAVRLAAGIELDPDRANIAPDAVRNPKGVARMRNRPDAGEKQPSPPFAAWHQRSLAVVQNKDCQLWYSDEARQAAQCSS